MSLSPKQFSPSAADTNMQRLLGAYGTHYGNTRRQYEPPGSSIAHSVASVHDLPSMTEAPAWDANFKPRVERTRQMKLYDRALADTRPASIAYPTDIDVDARSLSKSLMSTTMSASAFFTPDRHIPQLLPVWGGGHGTRTLTFLVKRHAKDHYTFEPVGPSSKVRGKPLTLNPGVVRDRDSVESVGQKLHTFYPSDVPTIVKHGDATIPGDTPHRLVRTAFAFKGKLLDETKPIGPQCLSCTFGKYF